MPKLNNFRPACLREFLARATETVSLLKSRLGFKLLAIVAVAVLVGTVFSSIVILSHQRQELEEITHASAQRDINIIQASLEHAMLTKDIAMFNQMMKSVVSEVGLGHICILDVTGQVQFSSIPDEVGRRLSRSDPRCSACHPPGTDPQSKPIPSSIIVGDNMLHVNVIANQPACYSCHGSVSRPLGLLLVESPLTDLRAQLRSSFWWLIFSELLTFALLIVLLVPALAKTVVHPVLQLARGASEIGAGNLDYQCRIDSLDELGKLAATFDTMRQRLKSELVEKERRNQELQMLNEITFAASQLLDPQQILDLTINIAVSSLGVDAGVIYLLDQDRGRFTLHACQGVSQCREMACDLHTFSRALAETAHPSGPVVSFTETNGESSYIGVSLRANGDLLGAMALITRPGQVVTKEGVEILKVMGEEIGHALANAIRFQNVRYRATLEERDRVAREMHDSLAQALGYLKLKATLTDDLLTGGEIDQAQANLREVKELAGKTCFDVREAIFGLRNIAAPGAEFLPTLKEYLNKYRIYYDLNVQLIVKNDHQPSFSPEASLQLSRIIHEALTNVRKHAGTNRASVRFERDNHSWRITVEDAGLGFNSNQVPKTGQQFFGLQIMRERAEIIGAKLEIDSQPSCGTRVIISVPSGGED